eukprot:scaffold5939_cov165-Ochromonas_danica.AAC.10
MANKTAARPAASQLTKQRLLPQLQQARRLVAALLGIHEALVDCDVLASSDACHLLALLSLEGHRSHGRVSGQRLFALHAPEVRMSVALLHVPLVELLHVSDSVQTAPGLYEIGVLGEQLGRHDASPVVLGLEVRVREADEELLQLTSLEVVRQVAHAVRPRSCHKVSGG